MRKIVTTVVAACLLLHGAVMSAQNLTATATNASGGNGSINLTVRGGFAPYTYAWTGPNGFQAATEDLNSIPSGRYCVTVTDGLCGTAGLCVDVVGCPTIDFNITSVPTCSNNGSLTVVGAPTNVAFSWSNGSTNSSITGLGAGTYTVTVTDPSGCQGVKSASVSSVAFTVDADREVKNACSVGSATGSITLYVYTLPRRPIPVSSTKGYTFQWSNGETKPNLTDLAAGNYTVTVTSKANPDCSVIRTFTVGNDFDQNVEVVVADYKNMSSCEERTCDGRVLLKVLRTDRPLTFNWTGPRGFSATTQDITSSVCYSGNYTVQISDANGCEKYLSQYLCCCDSDNGGSETPCWLTGQSALSITLDPKSPTTSTASNGSIQLNLVGGTQNNRITWTGPGVNGSSSRSLSNLGLGRYTVEVKDGCSELIESVELVACDKQNVVVTANATPTCVGSNIGTATASATANGTTIYQFKWSNGSSGKTLTGLSAGQYCVTATSINGCSNSQCATVSTTALVERFNTTDCSWIDQVCPINNAVINSKIRNVGSVIVRDGNTCTLQRRCNNGTSQPVIGGAGIYQEKQMVLVDDFGRFSCSVVQGCIWSGSTTFTPNRVIRAGQTREASNGNSCTTPEGYKGYQVDILCFDEPTRRELRIGVRCYPLVGPQEEGYQPEITLSNNIIKQKVKLAISDQVKNELKLTTDSLETTLLYFDQNKLSNNQSTTAEPVIIGKPTPNPFRDAFNIDITSMDNTKVGVQVSNSIGQVVYQKQEDLWAGKNQIIVELTGQPDGFYFVTITDAQNRKETRKIVKSKN